MTNTFDYANPEWVLEPAVSVLEMQALGWFAGTVNDVIVSLATAGVSDLPKRSVDGADFPMTHLRFLQRYPLTHLSLMSPETRDELMGDDIPPWYVLVHVEWELAVAELFETMAYHVEVRGLPYPGGWESSAEWIAHLHRMAEGARNVARLSQEDIDAVTAEVEAGQAAAR